MWTTLAIASLPARYRTDEAIWSVSEPPGAVVGLVVRGIKGQGGGAIPAAVTLGAIRQSLTGNVDLHAHESRVRAQVVNAVDVAEEQLHREVDRRAEGPMGATLVALVVSGGRAVIAHIGDCRAYRWRAHRLEQLTTDHTLAHDAVARASDPGVTTLAPETVLTRCLGFPSPGSTVEVRVETVLPDDRLLLCSPGLWRLLETTEIAACFERFRTAEECCAALEAAVVGRRADQEVSFLVAATV